MALWIQRKAGETIDPHPVHPAGESERELERLVFRVAHRHLADTPANQSDERRVGDVEEEVVPHFVLFDQLENLPFQPVTFHIEDDQRMLVDGEGVRQALTPAKRIMAQTQLASMITDVHLDAVFHWHAEQMLDRVDPVFDQQHLLPTSSFFTAASGHSPLSRSWYTVSMAAKTCRSSNNLCAF